MPEYFGLSTAHGVRTWAQPTAAGLDPERAGPGTPSGNAPSGEIGTL
jgi:hypothetical protein